MRLDSRLPGVSSALSIPAGGVELQADLAVPERPVGLVLFAHGSGSSRLSPRNQFVARALYEAGLGTLLTDLLTDEEEQIDRVSGHLRFNIQFLADRLVSIIDWLIVQEETTGLKIGVFGASTGAAAAIVAATRRNKFVSAVVSRGGRPDLAAEALEELTSPTLLIVGGRDSDVLELNKQALALIPAAKKLVIVPGATHLFEEPGALEQVAELAQNWFVKHLR
jgi:dienelactone hydrolase